MEWLINEIKWFYNEIHKKYIAGWFFSKSPKQFFHLFLFRGWRKFTGEKETEGSGISVCKNLFLRVKKIYSTDVELLVWLSNRTTYQNLESLKTLPDLNQLVSVGEIYRQASLFAE